MITGYKWTKGKQDKKTYIVTLQCNNEFVDPSTKIYQGESFYTTDCIVESIEDTDGNAIQEVDGCAYQNFFYYTGQAIKGDKIFYVHKKELLTNPLLCAKIFPTAVMGKLLAAWEGWNKAADKALADPLCMLSPSTDLFNQLRERYFFEAGFTIEDLMLIMYS